MCHQHVAWLKVTVPVVTTPLGQAGSVACQQWGAHAALACFATNGMVFGVP